MQFTVLIATLFAAAAVASPVEVVDLEARTKTPPAYDACPDGLYSNPQCCATDVLGVADLDCGNVKKTPTNAKDFQAVCAKGGQRARCCVLPILGQGVLCETPVGVVY